MPASHFLRNACLAVLLGMIPLVPALADPSEEEEAWLQVPGAVKIAVSSPLKVFAQEEIPAGLLRLLEGHISWDPEDPKHERPAKIEGFTYDLNKDGEPEYFIYDRMGSGSGGYYFGVYSEYHEQWKLIGEFQVCSLHVFPTDHGWPKMVGIGRCGGGCWTKHYMEFKDGGYKDVMLECYERGVITWAKPAPTPSP